MNITVTCTSGKLERFKPSIERCIGKIQLPCLTGRLDVTPRGEVTIETLGRLEADILESDLLASRIPFGLFLSGINKDGFYLEIVDEYQ